MRSIDLVIKKRAFILLMILFMVCIPVIQAGVISGGETAGVPELGGDQGVISEEVRRTVERTLRGFTGGFLENKGQKNGEIYFYTDSPQLSAGFAASEVRLVYHAPRTSTEEIPVTGGMEEEEVTGSTAVFSLTFPGSKAVTPVGEEPSTGAYSNFFLGNDRSRWSANNQYYGKVVYHGLYDNIDLVYGLKDGQIKYEFFVYPGGRVDDIQLQWNGPVTLEMQDRNIQVTVQPRTAGGDDRSSGFSFTDTAPACYQSTARDRLVEGSFKLLDSTTYGFSVKNYDQARLLIIDPLLLTYSTYISGSDQEDAKGLAVDSAGNLYVTGSTSSTDFPTTVNAFNETLNVGSSDVFVFKLAPSGNGIDDLLYCTFIGGSDFDEGIGIAVDSDGNAYITGVTYSSNFPTTTGAYNETIYGSENGDAFIFKLSPGGNKMVYSTYVGGYDQEDVYGIAVDSVGNIYITGSTRSTDFPTTVNAYNETFNGGINDVFVFKLSPGGKGVDDLLYSSYIGGNALDSPSVYSAIAVDAAGCLYVTGYTLSTDFPTTAGAYNPARGNALDSFIFKLFPGGNGVADLVYSTLIAGNDFDKTYAIAVDAAGCVYVTGETLSTDFPTTAGAYNQTPSNALDSFIFKLFPGGNGVADLVYSTFISGSDNDLGRDITIDSEGNIYITGRTRSIDFPTTANAYDQTFGGGTYYDAIVCKLSPGGNGVNDLLYSSYIGGILNDDGYDIAVDNAGNLYITGTTISADFPVMHGFNSTGDGYSNGDGFVLKFSYYASPAPPGDVSVTVTADQQVLLAWGPPVTDGNSPVLSYRVYRSTTSGSGHSFLAEVAGTAYLDPAAAPDTPYYYVVTAVNGLGESLYSTEVTVTVPGAPPLTVPGAPADLACYAGAGFAYLIWSAPANDGGSPVAGYRVYCGTSSGNYLLLGLTTSTDFNDTTVTGGIAYYYAVTAVNAVGESPYSNQASDVPSSPPVTPTTPVSTTPTSPTTPTSTVTTTTTGTEGPEPSPGWTLFILVPSLVVLFFRRRTFRKASKLQRNNDGGRK
ncbi:MAG: SBBP repeat-containing protein [Candidatus Odinarchaeota archaeon]